ncbi:VOC family protein [Dactylosporangium sp. NPDC051485]|uniref:VOC family protein n=1 Tax=Dactylosporangium sp. NPDC051485 TaxID=3154846 RepID=UPI0034147FDF
MTTPFTLTFDCAAPGRLAAFWCEALGYVPAGPPTGFDSWEQWLRAFAVPEEEWDDGAAIEDPSGAGPRISFLRVPEGSCCEGAIAESSEIARVATVCR